MKNLRAGGKKKSPEKMIANSLTHDIKQYDGSYWETSEKRSNNKRETATGLELLAQAAEFSDPDNLSEKPRVEVRAEFQRKSYGELTDKVKRRKLAAARDILASSCDNFLFTLDPALAEECRESFLPDLHKRREHVSSYILENPNAKLLLQGVKEFYDSIPANSPVRTSFIKTICSDCDPQFISEFLQIDIKNAKRVII